VGQVRQGEVDEKGRLLLRVYSNCVALKAMLSRVYSPQVPWSYSMSMFVEGKQQLRADGS
jgi:hypothetical protein